MLRRLYRLLSNYRFRIIRNAPSESLIYVNQLSKDIQNSYTSRSDTDGQVFQLDIRTPFTWIVPPASSFGGGFRTISRFLREFERQGFRQRVLVYHPLDMFNLGHQKDIWYKNFRIPRSINVELPRQSPISSNEVCLATGWQTISFVLSNSSYEKRIWFIQDDESTFHLSGDVQELVRSAYSSFPKAITAGPWLEAQALERGIPNVTKFDFGADPFYFAPKNESFRRRNQIVFYFQPSKPWRSPALVLAVARRVAKLFPDWDMLLVGEKEIESLRLPRNVKLIGALPPAELARVYAESKIGVVASLSNASLIPIEMVAFGLKVISYEGANSSWLLKDCVDVKYINWNYKQIMEELIHNIDNPKPLKCEIQHEYDWGVHIEKAVKKMVSG